LLTVSPHACSRKRIGAAGERGAGAGTVEQDGAQDADEAARGFCGLKS
jgi:hypothetical protein